MKGVPVFLTGNENRESYAEGCRSFAGDPFLYGYGIREKSELFQKTERTGGDTENGVLLIKGNIPGANKSFVTIKSTVK